MHVDLVQFLRLWVYNSEELAHTGTSVCSHYPRHAKRMDQRYTHEQQIAAAEKCPNPMIALRLSRLAVGVSVEEEGQAYEKLDYLLDRMEARLQHGPWVTGKMFSLADVAMAPMVNRIELLARPEMITRQPRVADWWRRIQARPGYQTAFSFKNSDTKDPVKR
jgi:glutathione S-transferase